MDMKWSVCKIYKPLLWLECLHVFVIMKFTFLKSIMIRSKNVNKKENQNISSKNTHVTFSRVWSQGKTINRIPLGLALCHLSCSTLDKGRKTLPGCQMGCCQSSIPQYLVGAPFKVVA